MAKDLDAIAERATALALRRNLRRPGLSCAIRGRGRTYTRLVTPDREEEEPYQHDVEWTSERDDEDEPIEPPPSGWAKASEVTGGLIALLLVSVGVMVLYVAGGVFLGLLTTAAPAVLALTLAFLLARYLSRR